MTSAAPARPSPNPLKPLRDGVTWLSYAQLSVYTLLVYSFGALQTYLRDEQGVSLALAGLYQTSFAVAGIAGGLTASRVVSALGRGRVLRLSSITLAVGVALIAWPGTSFPVSMVGLLVAGMAGNWLVIGVNAFVLAHQRSAGPASLTEANALASATGFFGPVLVGVGAGTVLGWRVTPIAIIVSLVAIELVRGTRITAFGESRAAAHETHRSLPLPRRVYPSLVLIALFLAIQFSMMFWGADLLREHAHFGQAAAAASVAAIAAGMLLGRLVGARLAQRVTGEVLLRASVLVTLVGFALAWVPTNGAVVVLGLLVTGLGISIQWPLGVARAVRASGGMNDRASALSSVFGSIATATAPFLLGALAEHVGFHAAFLVVPAFLVVALAILALCPVADA